MSNHYEYTIDDITYYVTGGHVYVKGDEEHKLEDIDNHAVHLYDGEVVHLMWGGEVHTLVEVKPVGKDTVHSSYVDTTEFETATPLHSLVPDHINECPDCGRWAGPEDQEPRCFECGYGVDRSEKEDG